jgi:hypothetical protein
MPAVFFWGRAFVFQLDFVASHSSGFVFQLSLLSRCHCLNQDLHDWRMFRIQLFQSFGILEKFRVTFIPAFLSFIPTTTFTSLFSSLFRGHLSAACADNCCSLIFSESQNSSLVPFLFFSPIPHSTFVKQKGIK